MKPTARHDPQDSRQEAETALGIAALRLPLRGYLRTLVPDLAACDDLVQETLLFLWERRDGVAEAVPINALAYKVAWFKALAWRRDQRRSRLVYFADDTLQQIAPVAEAMSRTAEDRLEALRTCLAGLPEEDLALLRLKYIDQGSLTRHAGELGWKPNRVQKTLSRLRLALRRCIQAKLQQES
jgi:RNA polymerase sigma-70 factor (ECF subfamily)